MLKLIDKVQNGRLLDFSIYDRILRFGSRLYVLKGDGLRDRILAKAHTSAYTIHFGANKMYQDLIMHYWWSSMKRDISDFVARCLTCQQVKIKHQRSASKIHPLEILV